MRNGGNGTKAYLFAYPTANSETATANAYKLLRNTHIAKVIQDYYKKLWDSKEKEIGKLFDNFLRMANSDISDVVEYDENGMIIKNFDTTDTFAVQSISETVTEGEKGTSVRKSVKMYDKNKPMAELSKILAMVTNKIDIEGEIVVKPAIRPPDPDKKPKKKRITNKKDKNIIKNNAITEMEGDNKTIDVTDTAVVEEVKDEIIEAVRPEE
jgi:hypothetical protein